MSAIKPLRLRWRLNEKERGLARIIAGPRGSALYDAEGKRYASVSALNRRLNAWYWVAGWGSGVPHMNTCNAPLPTAKEAKAAAKAYVEEHLAKVAANPSTKEQS